MLVYVSHPYTSPREPTQLKRLHVAMLYEQHLLRTRGCAVYSPVRIARLNSNLDDEVDWYAIDLQALERCDEMHVLRLRGWDASRGVRLEIEHAIEHGIKVVHIYDLSMLGDSICDWMQSEPDL